MISGRGGNGGGFGGFPYRSSHQQDQDGRGSGRGRGRRRRSGETFRPRSGNNNISFQAELNIPREQRALIVGRGGATLRWLKGITNANIFVPSVQQQQRTGQRSHRDTWVMEDNNELEADQPSQHPVRVNAVDLSILLHALYEISSTLSLSNDNDTTTISCVVKMRNKQQGNQPQGNIRVDGLLFLPRDEQQLLFGETIPNMNSTLCAYCIQTTLTEENVTIIVDNLRFVDLTVDACQWFLKQVASRSKGDSNDDVKHLLLVFGTDSCHPESICQALMEADLSTCATEKCDN